MQTLPQLPQLELSLVVSTQAPSQVLLLPQANAQLPFSQTWLAPQAFPHAPQFLGSELRLTQLPEQLS
jgi:hypothetical protein